MGVGSNKGVQILLYIVHCTLVAAVYGVATFFVIHRSLSGGVLLYAYLWNIAFIVVLLVFDKLANDALLSKEFAVNSRNYLIAMVVHSASLISFKTTLYLFYTFVLIVSRVSILEPSLISSDLQNFVLPIEYCLILLVVFDKFIEHLMKDDKRIKRITAKFDKFAARLMVVKKSKDKKSA